MQKPCVVMSSSARHRTQHTSTGDDAPAATCMGRRHVLLSMPAALLLPGMSQAAENVLQATVELGTQPPAASAVLMSRLQAATTPGSLLDRAFSAGDIRSPGNSLWTKPGFVECPRWLFGEWSVQSTYTGFRAPLGKRFVDPALLRAAEAPREQGGIGSVLAYSQRWYSTLPDTTANQIKFMLGTGVPSDAIVADRAFNTKSQTNAVLGYDGVAYVTYSLRDAPDRETVGFGGLAPDMRPLPPRKTELYISNTQSQSPAPDIFVTAELFRQVALGVRAVDVNDYEVVTVYAQTAAGRVEGVQRSVVYLEPRDQLYFEAGGRGVAVYDYQFVMERVPPPADAAELGAVACVLTPKNVTQCV